MTDDARDQFRCRQKNVDHQPGEGGAQAAFEAIGLLESAHFAAKVLTTDEHG
jgi:hypothetical protein